MYNLYIMCVYVNYACVHYVIMYTSAYIICVCVWMQNIVYVHAYVCMCVCVYVCM